MLPPTLMIISNTLNEEKTIDSQLNILKWNVQEIEQNILVLADLQYEYDLKSKSSKGQGESNINLQEEIVIGQMFTDLNKKREMVMKEIANTLTLAEQIQLSLISEEYPEWKKRQQMPGIGSPYNTLKGQLQSWQQVRQQLKKIQELVQKFTYNNDPLTLGKSRLDEQALSLFKNLILNSLVVERQPCILWHPRRPLVLKIVSQDQVVKLPELNSQPKVKIYIDKFRKFILLGIVDKVMNLDESSGCLAAEFCHLSLSVYEELHLISFDTQLVLPELCVDLSVKFLLQVEYIMGFLNKLPGTFLLRFSENSRCGGLITWVEHSQDDEPVVHSTEPYSKVDLNRISLPNIIRDYTVTDGEKDPVNPLIYLYPDIPRDVAFGRYYITASDENVGRNTKVIGWIPRELIKCIP
uniref:Signal transducer and activator of transcription 1b n=1 Tax=Sinocyclocheilus grahami TaxID=75366 RepID=A0A672R2R7_SINGR